MDIQGARRAREYEGDQTAPTINENIDLNNLLVMYTNVDSF
jgi:hypothetical protein